MGDELAAFYLGDWYVDTRANRLVRHDQELKIEYKVMAVLHYLARHQGELVTRENLEQAVWGKTVVGYDALTGCIARLRKVLDDDPRQPSYIETISKKGYRLIGEISTTRPSLTGGPAVPAPKRQKWLRHAGIGLFLFGLLGIGAYPLLSRHTVTPVTAAFHAQPSIVVLPFTNVSDGHGHDYFSDGMTADLTTALSKLSGLLVIAHASANSWRDTPASLADIAHTLGVQYVLQGDVQRQGNTLRVNVHLIDAERDIYLWSEQYDRELRSVFAVQDDITGHIVSALSVKLTQAEQRRTAHRYTRSIDAYDDFLRGQSLYGQHTREDNRLARHFYQQAIDRDSDFARAYSAMALTYVAERRYNWDTPGGQLDRALELARQAVSVDKELPQAYWVLAYVHVFRHEYAEAAAAASRAIELAPNFADSYVTLAVCKMHIDTPAEALHLMRKAMLRNPRYPAAYASVLGQIYYFLGDYTQAVPALRDAIDRNSNLLTPYVVLAAALSKLNRQEEAAWAALQIRNTAADFRIDQVAGMLPIHNAAIIQDMQQQLRRVGLK